MDVHLRNLIHFQTLSTLVLRMHRNPELTESYLLELLNLLPTVNSNVIEDLLSGIFSGITDIFARCNRNSSADQKLKCLITDALKIIFEKIRITSLPVFYNFYIFLLKHIYDKNQKDAVANIHEEYKLSIMTATTTLLKSITWDVRRTLYNREHGVFLCQILHISIQMAKNEKLRSLKLACIECIMALAQVHHDFSTENIEFRKQVADVFMFFAPGVISGLASIAVDDDKCGHKVTATAVQAWGKIVAMQMYNYNPALLNPFYSQDQNSDSHPKETSYKMHDDIKNYIQNSKMDLQWYKQSDEKLQKIISLLTKLTWHSHAKVRLELAHSCLLIAGNCAITIPLAVSKAVEILIKLSEDEDPDVSTTCKAGLKTFCDTFSPVTYKCLLENLEEQFFTSLTAVPRIFNSFDENQQISALNLVIGYLRTFGTNLEQVLRSASHSKRLLDTLLHISEFERRDIRLFEEYSIQDLRLDIDPLTPWKNFRYFRNDTVQKKIEMICTVLAELNTADEIIDLIVNIFYNYDDNRREATYILNNMLAGIPDKNVEEHFKLLYDVICMYIDPQYWKLPLEVSYQCLLPQVQYNVIQICLQIEGISKIATKMKQKFASLLCRILYPLLEHAGSVNPLIKIAAATAIAKISVACGYDSVSNLISKNSDYFSFHAINKMYKSEENLEALKVFTAVMKYSDITILPSISDVIFEILSQTYDKYFHDEYATAYLQLFKIFIESLRRWLRIEVIIEPIKTKHEKEEEHEHFRVANTNADYDSDDSVEESIKEDMKKWKKENEDDGEDSLDEQEDEEYEINTAPPYITLTATLLKTALNFLPSKDKTCKLLVLDILNNGLEVIRDWENDLLPIVHQIWSPLVQRFKETSDSLIINRSFELLVTLARLSKDFIRFRTVKDLLPSLITILKDLADHSYLKDHGATYRCTQAYKLQLNMLQQLSRVVVNLDMTDSDIDAVMNVVIFYLSDKQPIPLQNAAKGFYMDLLKYDSVLTTAMLENFLTNEEYTSKVKEYEVNINFCFKMIPRTAKNN
ncbi:hypothetical protein RN001_005485 [Aquatica leii]|uniref:TELO2-interacting protein 1 homolog n=1 Tax=Aquatica leii TaxID=1421715 RepID=A0AAN7SAL6_9COLE|nr:hypothetical protein RN001_005485 [Aquatica leii]